jgi:hypothetical protein
VPSCCPSPPPLPPHRRRSIVLAQPVPSARKAAAGKTRLASPRAALGSTSTSSVRHPPWVPLLPMGPLAAGALRHRCNVTPQALVRLHAGLQVPPTDIGQIRDSNPVSVTLRCYCSSYSTSIVASTVFIQWLLQYKPNSMKMVFSTNGVGSF